MGNVCYIAKSNYLERVQKYIKLYHDTAFLKRIQRRDGGGGSSDAIYVNCFTPKMRGMNLFKYIVYMHY